MRIKKIIKKILPQSIFYFVRGIVYPEKIDVLEERLNSLFFQWYQGVAAPDLNQKTVFRNAEFKIHSKHGNDGILAYLFSKIGTTSRTFVEIGVEDGRECNTTNLSLNFGWRGLLVDANEKWIASAKAYYQERLGNHAANVRPVSCFITAENVDQLLTDNGFRDEIDLLSIDIDSNDYWVWRSLTAVNPRVVVVEYNAAFGLRPLTIKYDPRFHYQETYRKNPLYFGASLSALATLGKEKGYTLVGCDKNGHDAFFVRNDVVKGKLAELSPEEAFYPNPHTVVVFGSADEQFERIKHLGLEKI